MVNAEHFRSVQEEILHLNGEVERRDIVLEQLSKALFLLVQEVGKLPETGNAMKQGPDLSKAYSDAYDLLVLIGESMEAPNA